MLGSFTRRDWYNQVSSSSRLHSSPWIHLPGRTALEGRAPR
ncbi:major histocompatibility complex, class II, DM beta, isoform CRA_b [Rattus norvegicus]|uniref:Major histocompatibility complex, class II, DM beta, isoform CRA_b n=1 Tax=Rattus norvegicus TaxID=10116 RepID=A6JJE6_RAT|nr:major histocompatibility complex, class II, DM beta, isoform CRA_b [Rattus norvegicus]